MFLLAKFCVDSSNSKNLLNFSLFQDQWFLILENLSENSDKLFKEKTKKPSINKYIFIRSVYMHKIDDRFKCSKKYLLLFILRDSSENNHMF